MATKVNDGTITSPARPKARMAISAEIVPLHIATQWRTPMNSAMRFSSSRTYGPSFGEPITVQNVSHALKEALAVANIGPADVGVVSSERRLASENG